MLRTMQTQTHQQQTLDVAISDSRHYAGGAPTAQLDHVHLDMEFLDSLSSLGTWCPHMEVLIADANQLTQVEGLAGAAASLQALSLRSNHLCGLDSLSCLRELCHLDLDSNKLTSLQGAASWTVYLGVLT